MQRLILFYPILIFLVSCGQPQAIGSKKNISDTVSNIEKITHGIQQEDEITPDTKKLRQQYVLGYSKPIEFETTCKGSNNEKIRIWCKYYCLFDSAVVIPGRYIYEDTTKNFTTHNFAEDIAITSNQDTIIKKTITKRDFIDKLPQHLKDYSVIFEPKFEGYDSNNDSFDFTVSVSIPITDLGTLMRISIKRNGQIIVEEAE